MVEKDPLVSAILDKLAPLLGDDWEARDLVMEKLVELESEFENLIYNRAYSEHKRGRHYVPTEHELFIQKVLIRTTNRAVEMLIESDKKIKGLLNESGDTESITPVP